MRGNNNCPYCRQTIIPMGSNVRQTPATPETTTPPPNQSNAQPDARRRGGETNAESRENDGGWWRAHMSTWMEQQSHRLSPALASAWDEVRVSREQQSHSLSTELASAWAAAGVAREGEWAYALAAASAARANEA